MAISVTENFRMTAGGRAWRMVALAHDGSVTSVSAGSLDLTYIQVIVGGYAYISMQANTSIPLNLQMPSITANNKGIAWAETDANAVSYLTIVGW